MHKGKKYVDSAKTIDRSKQYEPADALSAVVSTAKAKFDETVEIHVRLGVDIDPACEHPYVANNNARFLLKSVEELEASELERHYRKNGIKLLAGCAPCQTFSTYNQKATESDKRWWLLLQFSRLVDELSPDRPLLLNMTFYGMLPYYGVSYVDDSGETISYSINMSGKDGSVILTEFLPCTQCGTASNGR